MFWMWIVRVLCMMLMHILSWINVSTLVIHLFTKLTVQEVLYGSTTNDNWKGKVCMDYTKMTQQKTSLPKEHGRTTSIWAMVI
jgi:hypothetical protein